MSQSNNCDASEGLRFGSSGGLLERHHSGRWCARAQMLFAAIAAMFAVRGASAQTATWIGTAADADWHASSNWSPAQVPGPTSTVVIPPGPGSVQIVQTDVTVRSLIVRRPLRVRQTLFADSVDVMAPLTMGVHTGGTYTIGVGGSIDTTRDCTNNLWTGITIVGDVTNFTGYARWSGVTLVGSLTLQPGSSVQLEGNQTLTGTIIGNGGTILGGRGGPSICTIAASATVRGVSLRFQNSTFCGFSPPGLSVVNNGTILGNDAGSPLRIEVPFLNLGSVAGAVTLSGGQFGTSFVSAGPASNAVASTSRPDPGVGSSQSFVFQGLFITPSTAFVLGSGESLILAGGTGLLNIAAGAVFVANGVVIGSVYNAGLLVIPITRAGLISATAGGRIRIAPPPQPVPPTSLHPITVPSAAPLVVAPATVLQLGGSGFPVAGGGGSEGGGGGAGGGSFYRIDAPSVTAWGLVTWDGELGVTGSFTQAPSGTTRCFVAGSTRGETYSTLQIGQTASLSGSIQVVLQPELFDYLPSVGDTFDLVSAIGGITFGAGSPLVVEPLITLAGAERLGLSLPAFQSAYLQDPNTLLMLPTGTFSIALVDGGATLRATLELPVCSVIQPSGPADVRACPSASATFAVAGGGIAASYRWQFQLGSESEWIDLSDGFFVGFGAVSGATTAALTVAEPEVSASLRCVVRNACVPAGIASLAASLRLVSCPCTAADVAGTDGQVGPDGSINNGDFSLFFTEFFAAACPACGTTPVTPCGPADVADTAGSPGPDGCIDNGDFSLFFTSFFAGCP